MHRDLNVSEILMYSGKAKYINCSGTFKSSALNSLHHDLIDEEMNGTIECQISLFWQVTRRTITSLLCVTTVNVRKKQLIARQS